MSKKKVYATVTIATFNRVADANAAARNAQGRARVYTVAQDKCPASRPADHAHLRYDGKTFCQACQCYLSIDVRKES